MINILKFLKLFITFILSIIIIIDALLDDKIFQILKSSLLYNYLVKAFPLVYLGLLNFSLLVGKVILVLDMIFMFIIELL